ncbi:MAG: biotin-dependent carboxyltransferase family protein [Oscillospiraceae bacterium]|nr:biotin-dependent carboxyltransferase family protein [Oscillospiraceae bacterium]
MKISVISPGPLTTVQDAGRFGYMQSGFSPGGCMDARSMKIANILVGNEMGEGVLEMTMMGGTFSFDGTSVIAVTGADMKPTLNGEECPMYKAIEVKKGDVLALSRADSGMRAYLAVAGGFDLPLVMGSMSTNLKCKLGGFQGRKLQRGDEIPLRQSVNIAFVGKRKYKNEVKYTKSITLRAVLGPQDDYFTEKGIETFFEKTYTVTDKSDRMGIRLDGEKIESKNGVDIISDGVTTGSVQIPASGTPIIMMADRQTTGGYAKIATVLSSDLHLIAQAKPGTVIRFQKVTAEEAIKAYKAAEKEIRLFEYSMYFER